MAARGNRSERESVEVGSEEKRAQTEWKGERKRSSNVHRLHRDLTPAFTFRRACRGVVC